MVFKSDSNPATSGIDDSSAMVLAAADAVSPVSELNANNRKALCKAATLVHVQRNDQIKPENSHRWLMYLVEGSLNLYSGKEEVGVINANTKEALQPLFLDKSAYQSARTPTVARIVKFGREQLSILLKEQQKNAISVTDVQVGELENLVFDDIVAAIKQRSVTLASSRDAAVRILSSYKQVAGIPELAEVIQSDPGLAVHIVRVANSVDAGSTDATSSIRGAITRMGVEETRLNLAELLQRNTMVPANEIIGKRLRRYIQRTRLSSAIVQVLARGVPHLKPEVAMLVALTADVGELLILTHANEHADRFDDEQQLADVIDKLRVIVSSWLIADWDFPDIFVNACQTARDWYRNQSGDITYTDLVTAALLIIQSEMPEPKQSSIPSANNLLLARHLQQAGIDLTSPGEIVKAATGRLVSIETLLKAS